MKGNKTIIYMGAFELPDKNAAAHRVMSNAKLLSSLGIQTVFIDVDRSCKKKIQYTLHDSQGFDTWSMQRKAKRFYMIQDFLTVYNHYSNVIGVIAYNYPSIALYKLKLFCHKHNIRIISDCTEWYGFGGSNILTYLLKGFDSFLRMSIIQPKLDGIIVISKFLQNFYENRLPTLLLPPLVDLSEDKWKRNELLDLSTNNSLKLVYAGNPGKHKDKISLIVNSLTNLINKNYIFYIIGLSEQEYLKYYPKDKSIIKNYKDNIIFTGKVSNKEVIRYIQSCDYTIFYREVSRVTSAGFPTKFVESISAGTPVITTQTSDLNKYISGKENGYFLPTRNFEIELHKLIYELIYGNKDSPNVKIELFDFHNYTEHMLVWIKKILQ